MAKFQEMTDNIPSDRLVNASNINALVKNVQLDKDAFMNLDANEYSLKRQTNGQYKWHLNTQRETITTGFVVAEVSVDLRIGLLGERLESKLIVCVSFDLAERCINVMVEKTGQQRFR